jgi:transposase
MKKMYDSKFKSRVALEALRGDQTIAELAGKYQIHPNLVAQWKRKLQESASGVFMTKAERKSENKPYTEDDLMKKIGRLEVENDFLRSVSFALGLKPGKTK